MATPFNFNTKVAAPVAGTPTAAKSTRNAKTDEDKADAFINLTAVVNQRGDEFPLKGIKTYGIPVYIDKSQLGAKLIEQAMKNGGKLELKLTGNIVVVVPDDADADYGEF